MHNSSHDYEIEFVCIVMQMDSAGKAQKKQRPFDFSKYNTRHVALKIAYLGWDYQASQISNELPVLGTSC